MQTFRFLVADDHPLLLEGLKIALEAQPDFSVVGLASTGFEAFRLALQLKPDVAIIDVTLPDLSGLTVCKRIHEEEPGIRLIVLTAHESEAILKQAIDVGVLGYVLKNSAAEKLVPAIRAVLTGGLYVDDAIVGKVSGDIVIGNGSLTTREEHVLRRLALGYTNKEIANELGVSVKSIETYKSRGMEKLSLTSRSELVRYASVQGWLAVV